MRSWILAVLAFGCNGAETTTPTGETGQATTPDVYEPTWAGVQQLFVDHCDRCHPSQQYVDLHEAVPADILDTSYDYFVIAGDPDGSKLYRLLTNPQVPTESPMPFDTDPLPLETSDAIRVWIENGAVLD
jgi:hypothetical protein